MTVPVDGADRTPHMLHAAGHCFCGGFFPGLAWSPDGRELALVAIGLPAPNGDGLHVMAADGTGLHLLVQGATGPPAWQPVPAQPDSSRTATTAATGSGP
jgi:hypothetical protein